jgi:hypothetical protein
MCGVALYGDLEAALSHDNVVELRHRVETVKILPPAGQNDPEHSGAVTEVGIGKCRDTSAATTARVLHGCNERSGSRTREAIVVCRD